LILGAHESVAGGLDLAFERARADGCEALQIFSKSSSQWEARPLRAEEVRRFRAAWSDAGRPRLAIHGAYLINLASPDDALWRRSVRALAVEIRRAAMLGVPWVVIHPGSPLDRGEIFGIERVARGLGEALRRTRASDAGVLLENTAGQGAHIGWRFEHLRDILDAVSASQRTGVCFDTQHAHAAGYDLSTPRGYEATLLELDRIVGLARVRAFHLNDSKRPLGCRVDRHEHIGQGALGDLPFRRLVNDPRFAAVPGFLETPGRFQENLERLKSFRR